MKRLGGIPVEAAERYDFAAEALDGEEDMLKLACRLEHCAVLRQALGEAPVFMT